MVKKKEHVSTSKYWNYEGENNLNFLKQYLNYIKNFIENIFFIKIIKKKNFGIITDKKTYLISKELKKRKKIQLSKILKFFLSNLKIKCSTKKLLLDIAMHDKIYFELNPIQNNSGGIGYNNSLFLYIFLKNIKINMMIESGVWQGYTSYVIDKAQKGIKNLKFDISFDKLIYKSDKSEYNEFDIKKYNFDSKKKYLKNSAAFFDDHYSQLDRFLLSENLGIPFMIFDDDLNIEAIHSDGWPAIPTISMIREENIIKKFRWYNFGKIGNANLKFKFDKKKLKKYIIFSAPNISNITGYYVQSPMTFLKKK